MKTPKVPAKKAAAKKTATKTAAKKTDTPKQLTETTQEVETPDGGTVEEVSAEAVTLATAPIGTLLKFKGYAEEMEEEVLKPGDLVWLISKSVDEGQVLYNVDRNKGGAGIDSLVEAEIELATPEEISAHGAEAPAETAGKKKKAGKSKAATETTVAPETAAGTPAQEPVEHAAGPEEEAVDGEEEQEEEQAEETEEDGGEEPATGATESTSATGDVEAALAATMGVSKAVEAEKGDWLTAASRLVARKHVSDFTLGGVLAFIRKNEYYKQAKGVQFGSFAEYCDKQLGMKPRKADYLIQIYTKFTAAGVTEKEVMSIGWTKLREATSVVTQENAAEILEEARTKTLDQFKEGMQTRVVNSGNVHGNRSEVTTFTFKLPNDKGEVAKQAIIDACETLGIDPELPASKSAAFDHIITEWMSMSGTPAGTTEDPE